MVAGFTSLYKDVFTKADVGWSLIWMLMFCVVENYEVLQWVSLKHNIIF